MSSKLINHAEILRAKYLFEIDKFFNNAEFLRDKFRSDQKNIKKICNNIYKKLK